jgi:hypothetical protein
MIVLAVIFQWLLTVFSFGIAWTYMGTENANPVTLAIVWACFGVTATVSVICTFKAILQ